MGIDVVMIKNDNYINGIFLIGHYPGKIIKKNIIKDHNLIISDQYITSPVRQILKQFHLSLKRKAKSDKIERKKEILTFLNPNKCRPWIKKIQLGKFCDQLNQELLGREKE